MRKLQPFCTFLLSLGLSACAAARRKTVYSSQAGQAGTSLSTEMIAETDEIPQANHFNFETKR